MVKNQTKEIKYVKVPILKGFNHSECIGWVEIEEQYASDFPNMSLSPGWVAKPKPELLHFGFVSTKNFIESLKGYFNIE